MADHIEITTAHNIVIRYELANVVTRIMANVVDLVIIGIFAGLMGILFSGIPSLMYLLIFLPIAFYHLFFELWNNGQSLGKRLLKIKVVSLKGQSPSTEDLVMRWIFRLIDVTATLGSLSIISIISTQQNQRIGDVMAGTSIVKLRPHRSISLKDFENMETIDHDVSYPEVIKYNDQDILLIKDALSQLRSHTNESTQKMVNQLAAKISADLNVKIRKSEVPGFLKQVMNDYIILTR